MRTFWCMLLVLKGFAAMGQSVQAGLQNYFIRLGAYSAQPSQALSFAANQAALVNHSRFTASVFGEKRFLLNDLSFFQMALALPTTSGHFGLQAASFGGSAYNEAKAGIAYARSLGEKVSLGAQFNYINYRIPGYGQAGTVTVEGGVIWSVSDNLRTGLHLYNPSRSSLFKLAEEKLPLIISSGWGYNVSDHVFLTAEIIKAEDNPVTVHAGIQYTLSPAIALKGGVATGAGVFYMGSSFVLSHIILDVSASYHPLLGVTPGIMLTFNKKEK